MILTSRSLSYWFERIRALLASLVEELPIVIWPLVGYKKKGKRICKYVKQLKNNYIHEAIYSYYY